MWKTFLLLNIIYLSFVTESYQDVPADIHRQISVNRSGKLPTNFNKTGRKIEAVLDKNGIVIKILDRPKLRHRHGKRNNNKKKKQPYGGWTSETEKKIIENVRCRRYNRGYYFPNGCTNYCNCPFVYSKYNCAACPYRPTPTYFPPYVPPVIISK
ncbi:hypothetical protein WA026_017076 [Henosepilachna vigintioctopunctata]|uniref:Uncharacterized protein n=1 Tax=Henosepilachna vigintioctopunctata TaxID=420089 RepID=A0AAW1TPP0_9CUCU